MGQYTDISKEQLIEFSRVHVYYEIVMLYGVSAHLVKEIKDFYIFNALLESFVIHATIILDFFYKPQMKPDDAKAVHYIKDVRAWKAQLPKFESYFRLFYKRRSREVVHLSYRRLERKGAARSWHVEENTRKIRKVVDLFMKHLDPELVHPNLLKVNEG